MNIYLSINIHLYQVSILLLVGGVILYNLLKTVGQNYFEKVSKQMEQLKVEQNIENLPAGAKDLKELKYAGDFKQIEPQDCVDTPQFYGGEKHLLKI